MGCSDEDCGTVVMNCWKEESVNKGSWPILGVLPHHIHVEGLRKPIQFWVRIKDALGETMTGASRQSDEPFEAYYIPWIAVLQPAGLVRVLCRHFHSSAKGSCQDSLSPFLLGWLFHLESTAEITQRWVAYIMIVIIRGRAWMWKATVMACFKVSVVSRNSKVLKVNRQPLDTWKPSSGHNSCGLCFVNLHHLFGLWWYYAWLKYVLGIWWSRDLGTVSATTDLQ